MELTEAEVQQIDDEMNEHMGYHSIANNPGSWTCNPTCRRDGLRMAINRVLATREESNDQTTRTT